MAALSVVLIHYYHFYFVYPNISLLADNSREPFYWLFHPFFERGYIAVALFWVISGFVFCHVYGNRHDISARTFFSHRFSRLYPLHFVTLIAMAALQLGSLWLVGHEQISQIYYNNDLRHFIPQLFMASAWAFGDSVSFNAPVWSVSLEIPTYFGFLVLLKIRRVDLLLAIIAFAACNFMFDHYGNSSFLCARIFFCGVIVYRLNEWISLRSVRLNLVLAILAFTASVAAAIFIEGGAKIAKIHEWTVSAAAIWLLASIEHMKLPPVMAFTHYFRWIGDISYSSYLLHIPIQVAILIVWDWFGINHGLASSRMFFCAYLMLVIGLSFVSFHLFEMPLQKWLRFKMESKGGGRRRADQRRI